MRKSLHNLSEICWCWVSTPGPSAYQTCRTLYVRTLSCSNFCAPKIAFWSWKTPTIAMKNTTRAIESGSSSVWLLQLWCWNKSALRVSCPLGSLTSACLPVWCGCNPSVWVEARDQVVVHPTTHKTKTREESAEIFSVLRYCFFTDNKNSEFEEKKPLSRKTSSKTSLWSSRRKSIWREFPLALFLSKLGSFYICWTILKLLTKNKNDHHKIRKHTHFFPLLSVANVEMQFNFAATSFDKKWIECLLVTSIHFFLCWVLIPIPT